MFILVCHAVQDKTRRRTKAKENSLHNGRRGHRPLECYSTINENVKYKNQPSVFEIRASASETEMVTCLELANEAPEFVDITQEPASTGSSTCTATATPTPSVLLDITNWEKRTTLYGDTLTSDHGGTILPPNMLDKMLKKIDSLSKRKINAD